MTTNYKLFIGLNDKDTHKQEHNFQYYVNRIGKVIPNCTIVKCNGFYKSEPETSVQVIIYDCTLEQATDYARQFKQMFNQNEIALAEFVEQAIFI